VGYGLSPESANGPTSCAPDSAPEPALETPVIVCALLIFAATSLGNNLAM
jgi:hypothetical protein